MFRSIAIPLRVWLTLVVSMALGVPATAQARAPLRFGGSDAAESSRPLVVVRALGQVDSTQLRRVCRTILDHYPLRCQIGTPRSLLDLTSAWNPSRGQLDARAVLDELFRSRVQDALVELNVTAVDIYEREKPFVFGLASLTDRVGVVSLARVRTATDSPSPAGPHKRLQKLVLHEVGHALGLAHHDDPGCVMRQDATPQSLDTAPNGPCRHCHQMVAARATALARPGQIALDRIRGHLVRGEAPEARTHLVRALWDIPFDAGLLNRFALAFIEAGHWNEAISLLDLALKSNPQFAKAHVNRGLALQMRGRAGDLHEAITHFTLAIELHPEWGSVETHLDALRHQRARAQGPRR